MRSQNAQKSMKSSSVPLEEHFRKARQSNMISFWKKKEKMFQPIRGQGCHVGYQITLQSNYTSGGLLEDNIRQVW